MIASAGRSSPPVADAGRAALTHSGSDQAFLLLRTIFTVAPILFGVDKFTNILVDWTVYLAPWIDRIVPDSASVTMMVVGVIEIGAGLLVWFLPRIGGYVVAAWLLGIIINLLTMGQYFDIALRDLGLLVGALALARLATDRAVGTRTTGRFHA